MGQSLIPEIGNLSQFLQDLTERQRNNAEGDADGGIARMLGGRPPRSEREQVREEFSMYS